MFRIITFIIFTILIAAPQAIAKDIYYCPMHTFYTSDKPGNCPICGMTLVKKESHVHQTAADMIDHVPVSLNNEQMQLMGVQTTPAVKQKLLKMVRATGYVSTDHELYQVQDEYIRAHIAYAAVYRDYQRFANTRRNWESHRTLQLQLHEMQIKLLQLGLGETDIAKLQKVSWSSPWKQPELLFFKEGVNFWVIAQFFEEDLGFIEQGQVVDIEIPSYFEKAKGVIRSIGGILDPQTRTANALIELKDYKGELKGNMLANVTVHVELNEFLMVPQSAVMDTGLKKIVFVREKPGVFMPRFVEVNALGDNGWAIKSGLKEGEQVAVEGNFLLDSESRIQAGLEGSSTEGQKL